MLKRWRQGNWFWPLLIAAFVIGALGTRLAIAYFLATDEPGDAAVYSRLAMNLLEHGVFSLNTVPPFNPTISRLPGQPLFIAGIYAIFGHGNDTAVRIAEALIDTATCVIAAWIAYLWTADDSKRRRNAIWTFVLATVCPFVVIYAATLLTETLTTFLMAAMTLTATLALRSTNWKRSLLFWIGTGSLAGAAVMLRPDSGLFALGIGLTIVMVELFSRGAGDVKLSSRMFRSSWKGAVFSMAFMVMLAPWTIRNYYVFEVFQPLAPAHAEDAGGFVAHGYNRWLRTWVDDSRYVETMLWNLGEKRISIKKLPTHAFDSDDERAEIAALLTQYNHPPGTEVTESPDDSGSSNEADQSADESESSDSSDDTATESDSTADDSSDDDDDDENAASVLMTPEIDAAFGRIADARIERAPARYYFWLPAKRATALWFDSHSRYYPFGGQISPVRDLDYDESQQYWLPAFLLVFWLYTLLAVGGVVRLWRARSSSWRWLLLLLLMSIPRVVFLSTIENPEPRYVVELFFFTWILGGSFIGGLESGERVERRQEEQDRVWSLDVFRGITIAAMILVNDPGTWSAVYRPLEHADWNGLTPTDCIFPFFLFIVGVSISFALKRVNQAREPNFSIHRKIVRRAVVLFLLGIALNVFPFYDPWSGEWFQPDTVRVMGVLQRIAICYLVTAFLFLHASWGKQVIVVAALLLGYWILMTTVSVPGCVVTSVDDKTCNLAAYLDRLILGENHIWNQSKVFDPEGLFSTLPAIATTMLGALAGIWLQTREKEHEKAGGLALGGVALSVVGYLWSFVFPLNKSIWTSSFAILTAGLASCVFAFCYWAIDSLGYRRWTRPFVVLGSNAIALYVGSSIMSAVFNVWIVSTPTDESITLQEMFYQYFFASLASPQNASLFFAIWFVVIWWLAMSLLYRRGIFVKI